MKNDSQSGFTVLEFLMVLFMIIIILTLVLASFQRAKKNVRDDIRVADLQLLELSLEQYRAACKVYPNRLDEDANNAYGENNPTCNNTLGDFMPPQLAIELDDVYYQAYMSNMDSRNCDQYHMGILLDDNSKYQSRDDDWEPPPGVNSCSSNSTTPSEEGKDLYDIHRP